MCDELHGGFEIERAVSPGKGYLMFIHKKQSLSNRICIHKLPIENCSVLSRLLTAYPTQQTKNSRVFFDNDQEKLEKKAKEIAPNAPANQCKLCNKPKS